jgi:hypothetical protein
MEPTLTTSQTATGSFPALCLILLSLFIAAPAWASGGEAASVPALEGKTLSPLRGLPFLGILLSIAVLPLTCGHFWEKHYGKVTIFWSLLVIGGIAIEQGISVSLFSMLEIMLHTYLPFICLLLALFTVTGGIKFHGTFSGSPAGRWDLSSAACRAARANR